MMTYDTAFRLPQEGIVATYEGCSVVADLRDAAASAWRPARRHAERLEKAVEQYCVKSDQRPGAASMRSNVR
jgi:hypothetical protein